MAWHQAYDKIKPYVVRIETMDGFGTGFLFAYNKSHTIAAIATASHVIAKTIDWQQPIKVWHPASKKTSHLEKGDRAAWLDRRHDAATILIDADLFKFPSDVLPLVPAGKVKKIGIEVGWVGFPHLEPTKICFFSGVISAYVSAADSYLIDGVAINGVSGGPVFDDVLQAQDLTAFHDSIQKIRSFDEAKEKEQEQQKQVEQSKQSPQSDQSQAQ